MTTAVSRANNRLGRYTLRLQNPPRIASLAGVGGPLEGSGPIGPGLDHVYENHLLGLKSWEQAETRMMVDAAQICCEKNNIQPGEVDMFFASDLLNQIISSSYAARELDMPYLGLFGACSGLTEGLGLAAMAIDGGYARRALVAVSSHHLTAERQYRFPTEFAGQRPPTAQWTATGSAAVLLEAGGVGTVGITHVTFGRVIDPGLKDPFNMGAAMAPAAVDTITRHLEDTGRRIEDYDLIATGDLARVGHAIAAEMLTEAGYDPGDRFVDCGILLYDRETKDVHAGGSGCACSGLVFAGHLYPMLERGEIRRLLLVATGSLHSKISIQQSESIPGIAHAVALERMVESQ